MKKKDYIKGDDVKDPEKAMTRDSEKKKFAALNAFKVSRAEFVTWYGLSIGGEPDWSHPVVGWLFAAWVAGEGDREWLTEEEKEEIAKREEANRKRMETQAKKKEEQAKLSAKLAKERKKAANKAVKKAVKKPAKKAAKKVIKKAPKKVAKNMYRRK